MKRAIKYSYDQRSDVLYLSVGRPKSANTENEKYGILVRRDPSSSDIIGLTIIDFKYQIKNKVPIPDYLGELSMPPEIIDVIKKLSSDPSQLIG